MAEQFLKECKETRDNFAKVAGTYGISNHLELRTEIDSLLIMYDQLCERVRLANVDMGKNNALLPDVSACKTMALNVGDKVRITCEKFGHEFKIGEEVYITEVRPEENNYQATNNESSWAIEDEELVKCE